MSAPPLGPLAAFTGTFTGSGFNAIWRPQNPDTPSSPVPNDNILELNLTSETLRFDNSIGTLVNRGAAQGDIAFNGVDYTQIIFDIFDPNNPIGIHYEPGLWLFLPQTISPAQPDTVVRQANVAHGVNATMVGTAVTIPGPPAIPPMNASDSAIPSGINPFVTGTNPPQLTDEPALKVANANTARLPQNLSGSAITQAVLNDPNILLRNTIKGQNITSTTIINVSTEPDAPVSGGGVTNIAFNKPNALCVRARATFYIESITATTKLFGFWPITKTFTQIQYSQEVLLNFNGTTYPHVSVAILT